MSCMDCRSIVSSLQEDCNCYLHFSKEQKLISFGCPVETEELVLVFCQERAPFLKKKEVFETLPCKWRTALFYELVYLICMKISGFLQNNEQQ